MTHESFSSDCARLEQVLGNLVHAEERPAQGPGVPSVLPPAPTGRRSSVPRPTDPLLGRDRELAELEEMLGDPAVALVTMVGPGGMGKTRLAVELAHRLSGRREVEFVALDVVPSADLVVPTIAAQLQVKASPDQDLVHATCSCGNRPEPLAGARQLRARHGRRGRRGPARPCGRRAPASRDQPGVAATSAASTCSCSVPSRPDTDRRGCRRRPVLPTRASSGRTPRPGDRACRRSGRSASDSTGCLSPIELAAARTNVLSPDAILQRLDRRLGLLTGGTRDAHPRQRSLRACLEWSVELLGPDERQLFATMAVFAGGATVESLEAVCADVIPDVDVLTSLGSLVAKSLVDVVPNLAGQRFVMLETVREYAAELLGEPDEAGLRVAHARHIRDLLYADHRGAFWPPCNVEELAKWTAELPNARAAIAFANRRGRRRRWRPTSWSSLATCGTCGPSGRRWRGTRRGSSGQTGITTERRLELYDFAFMSQLMSDSRRAQASDR